MLPAHFIEDVRELIALAKECPEHLQEKCLQMLLEDFLKKSGSASKSAQKLPPKTDLETPAEEPDETPEESTNDKTENAPGQRDLIITDLHLKARKFLTQYSLTLDEINQLFYIEDDEIKPLYDDLKSSKAAETQVRIGLLQALRTGIKDGQFQFNGEDVRAECQERKAYDSKNFSANFKNSAALFSGFDKYDKNTPLKLSDAGKQRLAETIKELK